MNEDVNIQTLRDCYEKFGSGDIAGVLKHVSDDVTLTVPEVENSPYGGTWHGREAVESFFSILYSSEDINDYEAIEFIARGDRVFVLGRSTATVRATGRHYSTEWIHVHTMKDGQIVNFTEFFDTAAALRAFQKVTMALR